ncbi:hypothetical protein BOX15_Mlig004974g1, partial [Macrostomum lignano]
SKHWLLVLISVAAYNLLLTTDASRNLIRIVSHNNVGEFITYRFTKLADKGAKILVVTTEPRPGQTDVSAAFDPVTSLASFRLIVPPQLGTGTDKRQAHVPLGFCFLTSVPPQDHVPMRELRHRLASMMLSQKQSLLSFVANEDRGKLAHWASQSVAMATLVKVSPTLAKHCIRAIGRMGTAHFAPEDLTLSAQLRPHNPAMRTMLNQLKRAGINQQFPSITCRQAWSLDSNLASSSSSSGCVCQLAACLLWYPCGLLSCAAAQPAVDGSAPTCTNAFGLRSCRICHQFHFRADNVSACPLYA